MVDYGQKDDYNLYGPIVLFASYGEELWHLLHAPNAEKKYQIRLKSA